MQRGENMAKILIGVTGKKGHGKDSVAEIACSDFGFHRIALADKLKEIAGDLFDLSTHQLYGPLLAKETVDPRWNKSPREILQHLGTEGCRAIHDEVWLRYAMRAIEESPHERWVIPDVRFPNEASFVRSHGGVIWKVIRPGFKTGQAESHASETEIDKIDPDLILNNDKDLKNLEDLIKSVCERMLE
jgi:hypothetical protein